MDSARFPQDYDPYCEDCKTLFDSIEEAENHDCPAR